MATAKRGKQEQQDASVYVPTRYEARFNVEDQDEHTERTEEITEALGGEVK